ncbi:MAG TPA: hypothetical protein DEQ47_04660 [Solibacterales bacterium]|nr:hypothetical protein [Bryobacterales bacterium]
MRFALPFLFDVAAFAQPDIPKTWDAKKLSTFELPPPFPGVDYKRVSADYYYKIPAFTIYKTYPVYAPGREPQGYWEHLHQVEPQIAFNPLKLKTVADWTAAGEAVFDFPTISLRMPVLSKPVPTTSAIASGIGN